MPHSSLRNTGENLAVSQPMTYQSNSWYSVASAAEAELGALFLNYKEGKIQHLILYFKNLVIPNHQLQYTAIMGRQLEQPMKVSRSNVHGRWQCDSFVATQTRDFSIAASAQSKCVRTLPNGYYTRTSAFLRIPSTSTKSSIYGRAMQP
eukprot:scaffold1934_cov76-Cyclotella_meneghiniana.AAC.12